MIKVGENEDDSVDGDPALLDMRAVESSEDYIEPHFKVED
jgi:hypothetical protein